MFSQLTYWHPIFVHFTVALWSAAFLFYFLSLFAADDSRYKHQWLTVGRWNLWLGMAMTLLTLGAGWVAYNSVNHDTPSHLLMQDHRSWALSTASLFVLLTLWSLWLFAKGREEPKRFVLLMFLAVGLLGTTGWYGGELVYRHGLAVMSMPNPDEHDRDHDHGDVHDEMHGDVGSEEHDDSMMGESTDDHDHDGHEHAPHSHE
jgi:uncharacterized membrane protein